MWYNIYKFSKSKPKVTKNSLTMKGEKKMENIGIAKMREELIRLNPGAKLDVRDYTVSPVITIYGNVLGASLNLPEGYYYNEKNGITNKHNTESGVYESFTYQFDTAHFEERPTEVKTSEPIKAKKSLFARIFG